MNYQDFIEKITNTGIKINSRTGIPDIDEKLFTKRGANFDFVIEYFEIGGVSGGSCWENSNPCAYTAHDRPKEFGGMDRILLAICPNITYLQYKSLAHLVETHEATEYEYYGNRTDYEYWILKLLPLYNALVEMQVI